MAYCLPAACESLLVSPAMKDQDFYLVSYLLQGDGLPYRVSSDSVFKAVEVARWSGLESAVTPRLMEADPAGEIELSETMMITTSVNQGAASRNVALDVYRVFAPGSYRFAPDGRISGSVAGVLLVKSDESVSGKMFSQPIDLDRYSRQQFLDLMLQVDGEAINSSDGFRQYLAPGWQQDPFAPDLLAPAGTAGGGAVISLPKAAGVTRYASGRGDRLEASKEVDDIYLRPMAFGAAAADRITNFDFAKDRLFIDGARLGGASTAAFSVIPAVASFAGRAKAEKKAYQKALKAQKKRLKKLGRSGESLIYNQQAGELIYDQNGAAKGFGSGGVFAIFEDRAALSSSNLVLF